MVTAARSRNIRFTFIIQNFAQLYEVYGKENGETIKGNCGNIVYLISTEMSALEEISKMCGEVKSKEKEKTSSTPLVTVSDLQRLEQWETIILRLREMPFKTKLTPDFQMNWGHSFPKAEYPQREKNPVEILNHKSDTGEALSKWENIVGKFIYAISSNDTPYSTFGNNNLTITSANIPSHLHRITLETSYDGEHSHSMEGNSEWRGGSGKVCTGGDTSPATRSWTHNGGSHSHYATISTSDSCGSSSGVDPINIVPAHIPVYMWRRLE
jgi:hypothetical protein